MATIRIYGYGIIADADIEPPRVDWLHSVGGAQHVPAHDRRAHALGRKHECARVRSAREYVGDIRDYRDYRRTILDQYANHTLIWMGDWSRYDD